MKFIEFSKILNDDSLERAYVLQGDDGYFVKTAKSRIVLQCKIQNEQMNLSKFDENSKNEFFSSLNLFPLMSKYRFSCISIDKQDDEFFKKFEKYASNPNPDVVAVVINNSKKITEKQGICVIDCDKEKMPVLKKWVVNAFKRENKVIDEESAVKVVERCNFDMMKISSVVEIISCYLSKTETVGLNAVDELVPFEAEAEIYDLINAIVDKDSAKAMSLYDKFKSQKIEDTKIIALLYGNYRRMFLSAITEGSNEELASELKVKPYAIQKARSLARSYTKGRLKNCLDILIRLENGIKTGNLINPDLMRVGILTLIEK